MLFRDMELDFDIFNADDAELYEQAAKEAQKTAVKKQGETLADAIRRQCRGVFQFFDTLFGDGFHRELFGERTNLMECIGAFREFVQLVDEQRGALSDLMAQVEAEGGTAPNRAARRASTWAKPSKE